MWHRTDPVAPRRAVPVLADLAARGLLSAEEAAAALASAPAPGADRAGWAARRAWALFDLRADRDRVRRLAARAICQALAPLLAARASRGALEAAAAAADPGAALTRAERAALLHAEVACILGSGGAVRHAAARSGEKAG